MRDPRLMILAAVAQHPKKPLKVYLELSGVSRATFFKAKAELAERLALSVVDSKHLEVNHAAAKDFLAEAYPGLVDVMLREAYWLLPEERDMRDSNGRDSASV